MVNWDEKVGSADVLLLIYSPTPPGLIVFWQN